MGIRTLALAAIAITASFFTAAATPTAWKAFGPPGGGVAALATDPADGRRALALSSDMQTLLTRDGGASWRSVGSSPCSPDLSFALAQIDRGAFYLTCGGTFRSRNEGVTWERLGPADDVFFNSISAILFHPTQAGFAVAPYASFREQGSIYITRDDGRTWNRQILRTAEVRAAALDPGRPESIMVLAREFSPGFPKGTISVSVYETSGNEDWLRRGTVTSWESPPADGTPTCYGENIYVRGTDLLVVAECGVFVSRTRGTTWTLMANSELGLPGSGALKSAFDPVTGRLAVVRGGIVAESGDGGATWSAKAAPGDAPQLLLASDGASWLWQQGLYRRASSAAAWTQTIGQRSDISARVVAAHADPRIVISLASAEGTQRSLDSGVSWTPIRVQGESLTSVVGVPRSTAFYGTTGPADSPALHRSPDGGATWTLVNSTLRANGHRIARLSPAGDQPGRLYGVTFEEGPDFDGRIQTRSYDVMRSSDGGATWATMAHPPGIYIYQVVGTPQADLVYATTEMGGFRSIDGGTTWSAMATPGTGGPAAIVVDALDPQRIYGVSSNYGYWMSASDDAGTTWRDSPRPDLRTFYFDVVADPDDSGRVFAVTQAGAVFESRDGARSWRQRTAGEPLRALDKASASVARNGAGRSVLATQKSGLRLDLDESELVVGSGLWWNPAESGWGISLTQHLGGNIFGALYAYDASGSPQWQVIPGGTWLDARTFQGKVYRTTGPAYFTPAGTFDPGAVNATEVGVATLTFAGVDNATLDARIDGATIRKAITRQPFGPVIAYPQLDLADLWWNPNESGWGIAINQQYSNLFLTWYVYDSLGKATWVVSPDMTYQRDARPGAGEDQYTGKLYTTRGPALAGFDPTKVVATQVGTVGLRLLSRHEAILSYTAFGRTQSRYITRQPF